MKEQHKLRIFEIVILKTQNENTADPAKTYARKILRTRNHRHKFIKNLLPEKHKENI